ncbi:mechanosensitive ion channel family protein [Halolamina sp. C58]|uniref:mechanosensitive ion channel family protein n=1 Tax=Halolamina sp. C58 TaxID=3421640 RepID=UPI003EC0F2B8
MSRSSFLGAIAVAVAAGATGWYVSTATPLGVAVGDTPLDPLVARALLALSFTAVVFGCYRLVLSWLTRDATKRRQHDLRNVLRLGFGVVGLVGVLGALTDQWLGVLFSLGVVGFAITFALQQPLLSLLGWVYITAKRPYGVGDRVRIGDVKGDVVAVDFLVTTLWEVGGELVSTNQPSGRRVTVPNSVVLSADLTTFGGAGGEFVWNELSVQVAYETELPYARELMVEEAEALLGDEMRRRVERYRDELSETAVELTVDEAPTVNVVQRESWVELRLRYLVDPRRATRTRNRLYERILERFNEAPDRIRFPVSRNR